MCSGELLSKVLGSRIAFYQLLGLKLSTNGDRFDFRGASDIMRIVLKYFYVTYRFRLYSAYGSEKMYNIRNEK